MPLSIVSLIETHCPCWTWMFQDTAQLLNILDYPLGNSMTYTSPYWYGGAVLTTFSGMEHPLTAHFMIKPPTGGWERLIGVIFWYDFFEVGVELEKQFSEDNFSSELHWVTLLDFQIVWLKPHVGYSQFSWWVDWKIILSTDFVTLEVYFSFWHK